jgi:hypothetical protein
VLYYQNCETEAGVGRSALTWTGTLNVAGVTFDTTSPHIAGALPKVAKARTAAGARVRFAVSAIDETDGAVPAMCRPKSGSLFRVGRTIVTCAAVDRSGNTTAAHFAISVKRDRSDLTQAKGTPCRNEARRSAT